MWESLPDPKLSSLSELAVVGSSSLASLSLSDSSEVLCLGARGMGDVSDSGRCLKGLSWLKYTTLHFFNFFSS